MDSHWRAHKFEVPTVSAIKEQCLLNETILWNTNKIVFWCTHIIVMFLEIDFDKKN